MIELYMKTIIIIIIVGTAMLMRLIHCGTPAEPIIPEQFIADSTNICGVGIAQISMIDEEAFVFPERVSIYVNNKEALCIDYSGDQIEFICTNQTAAGEAFVLWLDKYVNARFELKEGK